MLKLNPKSKLNSSRTPHESHKLMEKFLSAGGFEREQRVGVFWDGNDVDGIYLIMWDGEIGDYRLLSCTVDGSKTADEIAKMQTR